MLTLASTFDLLSSPEWRPIVEKVAAVVLGSSFTLLCTYVVTARDVAYIKGQLENIQDSNARIEALAEQQGSLRKDISKIKRHIGLSFHG